MDEVAEAIRAGDRERFAELAGCHQHELEVHCYRMLGSYSDAEDVVQETLLRAWRRRETFEGRATPRLALPGSPPTPASTCCPARRCWSRSGCRRNSEVHRFLPPAPAVIRAPTTTKDGDMNTDDKQLRALDRLAGTWRVTGGAEGTVTYRWLDGGFFLIQEIDLVQDGRPVKGMEVIGRERPFGAGPGEDVTSRYYGSQGETFDYVYEIDGDTLTIWGGEKGSPAYYRGTFDGDAVSGAWVYPGGGGYESRMTRVN